MPIKKKPKADKPKKTYEKPVSLFPLDFDTAMKKLLKVSSSNTAQNKPIGNNPVKSHQHKQ